MKLQEYTKGMDLALHTSYFIFENKTKYLFFQISWVRIRDWHILTNGLVRFTTDDRFNVLYKEGSFNWILQVRNNPQPPHKGRTFLANFQGR